MRLPELRVHFDRLAVIANRLFKIMLGRREYPKLEVSVAAFRIDGHGFGEKGFHLLRGLVVHWRWLLFPDGHGVKVVGERVAGLLLHKSGQSGLNAWQRLGCGQLYLAHKNVGLSVVRVQVGSLTETLGRL